MRAFLRDLPAPTVRLYLAAMLLVAPLALGQVVPAFIGVAAAGAVALLAIMLGDLGAAVRGADLEVRREHHPRLYLNDDNVVELVVANRGRRPALVRLRDTPPTSFRTDTLFTGGVAPAATEVRFRYVTRPAERGRYRFGSITLRWRTPLGLLWRQR